MDRYNIDFSGIQQLLDLTKSGRQRKIARLWYANQMSVEDIAKAMGYNPSVIVSEIVIINNLIKDNIFAGFCSQCEQVFYTTGKKKKLCDSCREKNQKDREERTKELYKSYNSEPKTVKKEKFKSLSQIEKERAKYNKEHKTWLSYGQYVNMVKK